jgi:hypothetical protein
VDVLETTQDLVQKVLDKLLFERARGEETVQVGTEQFGDKVAIKGQYGAGGIVDIDVRGLALSSAATQKCRFSLHHLHAQVSQCITASYSGAVTTALDDARTAG